MERAIRGVSLDADGTLFGTYVESSRGFERFFLEAARSCGKEITLEILHPILSRIREDIARRREAGFNPYTSQENSRVHWLWYYEEVFAALDLPEPKTMAQDFLARYESGEFTRLYPDTLPCLTALKSRGIPMILISNFSPVLVRFLENLGVAGFFKSFLISGTQGIEKPDRRLFLAGAESLGLSAGEILHVGNDPEEDYRGALQAGFQALLLDRDSLFAGLGVPRISRLLDLPLYVAGEKR